MTPNGINFSQTIFNFIKITVQCSYTIPLLLAESKGLGSLRSPSSLLRKLSYYRLLLTRLRLAKDCKGSNLVFTFKQKTGRSKCCALFFMAESKGFGSLRSPSSLLRKLSYYRLLLTRLRLAKDCKGSNPVFTFKQKTGRSKCCALFFMAESKGFEPSNRFRRLHDFQSCSFDQLGQLSIDQITKDIIYDFIKKSKQYFCITQISASYRKIILKGLKYFFAPCSREVLFVLKATYTNTITVWELCPIHEIQFYAYQT